MLDLIKVLRQPPRSEKASFSVLGVTHLSYWTVYTAISAIGSLLGHGGQTLLTTGALGSGLVGGTFAPSLFLGATTGAVYQEVLQARLKLCLSMYVCCVSVQL